MNKKRIVALMAAATMLLNVTPVMAAQTVSQGGTTVSGTGSTIAYDKTPKYMVTLPTANALNFVVDPYGLLDIASGSSVNVDDLANSGAIASASGSAAIIKNESSVPITVSLSITATNTTNDIVFKTKGSEVATGTAANMFLALIPSSVRAAGADDYVAADYAIPATTTASTAKFKLSNADYEIVESGGSYTMGLVSKAANYDATTLKVGGLANPEADWTEFLSTSDVGLSVVFSYAPSVDADVVDETSGVYGLVSGSAAGMTDDLGGVAVGGAYTKTFDGTHDVTFMVPAGATKLDLIHAGGVDFAKGTVSMQPTGFDYNPTTGELVIKAAYLNGTTTKAQFLVYGITGDPDTEVTITVNYQ